MLLISCIDVLYCYSYCIYAVYCYVPIFYKKLKNVSCEYDRLNG